MRGHTLVELTFVLLLVGVAVSSIAPTARRAGEKAAVAAAREALVGLLAEARQAAIESGGATVRLSEGTGLVELSVGGDTLRRLQVGSELGVTLALGGARPDVELHYDALGLGRMTSQTIVLRRGDAVAQLIVSSYGRVRRR